MSEVELTCDRAAFIRQGRIVDTVDLREAPEMQLLVLLRVGQPDESLPSALAQFGNDVRFDDSTGRYTLLLPDSANLPRMASWLIGHGYTLYELTPQRQSLEERFVKLMS